jgi:hypothetical protein
MASRGTACNDGVPLSNAGRTHRAAFSPLSFGEIHA